jgi:hypothetical protein
VTGRRRRGAGTCGRVASGRGPRRVATARIPDRADRAPTRGGPRSGTPHRPDHVAQRSGSHAPGPGQPPADRRGGRRRRRTLMSPAGAPLWIRR